MITSQSALQVGPRNIFISASSNQPASESPATDQSLYFGIAYVSTRSQQVSFPISLVVPVSEIPFVRRSDHDKARLDVIGVVLDGEQHPITRIRDTVKLAIDTSSEVKTSNRRDASISLLRPGFVFEGRDEFTGQIDEPSFGHTAGCCVVVPFVSVTGPGGLYPHAV
ncbi:MAG TPA: hypothetical protein VMB18_09840 [Terriglobales bacterium]|nr:hypothetical protein [Terriglobales bacterium]